MIEILKMEGDIHPVAKCPTTLGLSECPSTHPYSYNQGYSCCKENIDHDSKNSAHPLLNFDSNTCKDDAGTDRFIACDSPPCVNFQCHRYNCILKNKDISGGEFMAKFFNNHQINFNLYQRPSRR
jgi:hypothetical protein